MVRLLGEEMKKSEKANGFVIDGFPANLNQGMKNDDLTHILSKVYLYFIIFSKHKSIIMLNVL